MSIDMPPTTPEKKEALDDNARKFTLDSLDPQSITDDTVTSYLLTTDWTEKSPSREKKIVRKEYPDGKIQILLIEKLREGTNTTVPPKIVLTEEESAAIVAETPPVEHVVKVRNEFTYTQNDRKFSLKYDEFADSQLRVLEVDAKDDETRAAFDEKAFPVPLIEVTGDIRYYGYNVAGMV